MLRLIKYLKPYVPLIALAIVLLFTQAMADLSLPDYMSKIVNDGIQQSGVTSAVPSALRQSQMNRLTIFMSPGDKTRVLADYALVDKSSPDYGKYLADYPDLANEPIYVLKGVDKAEMDRLNPVIGKAFLAVAGVQQVMADPTKAAAMAQGSGLDLSKLPAGTDLFALMARLPAAQLTQITGAINKQFAAMGDSMIIQSAAGLVKTEYSALGMDTGKLQSNYIIHTGIPVSYTHLRAHE